LSKRLNVALVLLINLLANLQSSENLDEEDRELIMELNPLVVQCQEEAIQQGIEAEDRSLSEKLLRFRIESLDDELTAIIQDWIGLQTQYFTSLCCNYLSYIVKICWLDLEGKIYEISPLYWL
jgi:superfamily II helicase